jgi:hypothetical protein
MAHLRVAKLDDGIRLGERCENESTAWLTILNHLATEGTNAYVKFPLKLELSLCLTDAQVIAH